MSFAPVRKPTFHTIQLFMGKGFNRAGNKQAELLKKMQLAKKQKGEEPPSEDPDGREETDELRQEFAELLAKSKPIQNEEEFGQSVKKIPVEPRETRVGPKVKAKEIKRRKKAKAKKKDPEDNEEVEEELVLFGEGDIAQRQHFEKLLSFETTQPLGPMGAAQLVPWVPPFLSKYLVVLADPRKQSGDLRQSIQYLTSTLSPDILDQVLVITADPNEETKKWMTRAGIDTPIRFFSDPKLEWMQTYSAVVPDDRWSMSIFIFCTDGVIQKLSRRVDPSNASEIIADFVQSM